MKIFFKVNKLFIFFADIIIVAIAYYCSYLIRFEGSISISELNNFYNTIVWIVPIKIIFLGFFKLYRGMFRYTGINELVNLVKATLCSSTAIVLILLMVHRFLGFPRSVFIIDFLLSMIFLGGYRVSIRLFYYRNVLKKQEAKSYFSKKNILIIGAGDAGEKTLRELIDNKNLSFKVVGFIDDNPSKIGRTIHSVPVLGSLDDLKSIIQENKVEEVLIAVSKASGKQMRRFVEACEKSKVSFKTLPGMGELINGKVSIKTLRDVNYHDLLGRPIVETNEDEISKLLKNKIVLVTGAGGSIGSELCRQIIKYNPEKLILVDASEINLYTIEMELNHRTKYLKYIPILCSIKNEIILNKIFKQYKPCVVFHAAAYKHVPLLESNPWMAITNNVIGSLNLINCCLANNVNYFVLVSTDKAVRSTNVMGASKRMSELLMHGLKQSGTKMAIVRFGNVVGSSGSVIPLFKKQIAIGGPVTVTHPEVTRFFMTIPEAAQLILQAGSMGDDSEIFILKMGTSIKIVDMARDLIRLSGKEPGKDIEVVFTGLRPGEKLYEELITEEEGIASTQHDKIMVLKKNGIANGHNNKEEYKKWLLDEVEELKQMSNVYDGAGIRKKLKEIIPEYEPQDSKCIL